MAQATLTPSAPLTGIQGVATPNFVQDPPSFYANTRRQRYSMQGLTTFAGVGSADLVQLRKSGIVAGLEVRVVGNVVFGGTITGTTMSYSWPFGLVKRAQVSANGQSNLIDERGLTNRAHEFITNPELTDSGISATFGSTAVTSGSLKLPTDDWGTSSSNKLNPGASVAATGTYTVDLTYYIPIAANPVSLTGAIFAQSAATNLVLQLAWETQTNLVTLGGSATVDFSGLQFEVTGVVFSIPQVNGRFCVPDLSQFHQIVENRQSGLGAGGNEIRLYGTGVGRYLMRILFQTSATVSSVVTPLSVTDANYNTLEWKYGGNDTPETYDHGGLLRANNLRVCGDDLGGNWGIGLWDFANQFALRDIVDTGATDDLRVNLGLVNAPTSGFAFVATEYLFAAPVGA